MTPPPLTIHSLVFQGTLSGITTPPQHESSLETSVVFVETSRDLALATPLANYGELLAFVAAHEIGHQFNLAFGEPGNHDPSQDGLMSVVGLGQNAKVTERFLSAVDAMIIRRRVRSPGQASELNFYTPSDSN